MDTFQTAFNKTMEHEGFVSFDHYGGETFMGISRVYWPDWEGWEIIDKVTMDGGKLSVQTDLPFLVRKFYRQTFWNTFRGDDVAEINKAVAIELFDTAVNLGVHRAVAYLQDALNLLNRNERCYPDMVVDGILGPKTLGNLRIYMTQNPKSEIKETILLNVMNTLQGSEYIRLMRANPLKERFRGWFNRV